MEQALKAFFILLLIIFPLGQIARLELGGGVNLLFNDAIVGIISLTWFCGKVVRHKPFRKTPLTKPILLFVALAFFSLVTAFPRLMPNEFFISFLYLVRWISYVGLYFVVIDFDNVFKRKVIVGLLISAIIIAVLGLLQYIFYPNLRNLFYAGWDEHLFRLFSTFLDPNFAGGVFVFAVLLSFSQISLTRSHLARLGLLTAAVTLFASLLLTYSRGSFLSFAAGVLTFLALTGRKKIAVLVIILFIMGVFMLPKDLGGEGVNLLRSASIEARFASSEEALMIFQKHPLFGIGFNAYRYARQELGFSVRNEFGDIHSAAGTDNSFLFVLATTGVAGLTVYLYLWYRLITVFRRNALVLSTIAALFIHALFVNSLFYPHIMEWLWILIGVSQIPKVQK